MRLQQMGDEFVSQLEVLKDDLNKIYGKTGLREKIKKTFQSKAILDRINQHKVYVKDARDKLVATAVLSTARQVGKIVDVDAKVTDIHNHLMSPSRIQPVKYVSAYSLKYNSSYDSPLISSIMVSAIPPPAPSIFLGRDDLVQEGIANLLADSPHSIIIMGFGGMGKTSLALKILNDEAVEAKYGAHRYFIPCDIVCSVDSTVEILLQTVMQLMNLDLTGDAVKQLHTISAPTILIFDNFETVWDQSSDQYSIQMLLAQLNSVRQITLMITMRGSVAPIEDVNWLMLPHNGLSPVDEFISLDIFNAISRYTSDEEVVKELVKELEGWPLAITLMAYQAKILSPKILSKCWCQEKTYLLQRPGTQAHRLSSVDISIKITLQSQLLLSEPNALKLLSVLCYLPNGIPTWMSLIHKMLSDLPTRTLIVSKLLQSGIIYKDNKDGLKLLQPIQEYLKTYWEQPDMSIKAQIGIFYLNEIKHRNFKNTNSGENIKFGILHSKNIEWILSTLLDDDFNENDLTIIYEFCYFQSMVWESDKLLRKIVSVTKEKNLSSLYACTLLLLGKRHLFNDQYKLAQIYIYKAMQIFENMKDILRVAECVQSLGETLYIRNQYLEATTKLQKAMQIFTNNRDFLGVAQCWQRLGDILRMSDQYSEATTKLKKAMQMFVMIENSLGVAQCLYSLGNILYMTNQYSEATLKLEKAMQIFESFENFHQIAQCLQSLANILYMRNQSSKAIVKLEKAIQIFENRRNFFRVALCLQSLGDILYMRNDYIRATVALEKAIQIFEDIGDNFKKAEVAQCLQSLGNTFYMKNQYTKARIRLENAIQIFEDIGDSYRIAQCLQSLGNILRLRNQYSEATVKLEKAMQIFENHNNRLEATQCLQSLGNILQMKISYSNATVKLEKAMQIFEDMENLLGAAQCLRSLGNILRMRKQYPEATVKLEKAMQIFENIGNFHDAAQCLQSLKNILYIKNQYLKATTKQEKADVL
ncbi:hypothetical protein EDD18DRAFT_1273820 [Armillaria luteobubalina]|uniref:TPR-like protein n=1 Tax=Armillaria luteobubalina TaxID=153913 RepID=A0AA39UWU3_9AGAR|nr:hypothetical protein EDD18DRAFT_1273820 [Armillaria luteobubalina]